MPSVEPIFRHQRSDAINRSTHRKDGKNFNAAALEKVATPRRPTAADKAMQRPSTCYQRSETIGEPDLAHAVQGPRRVSGTARMMTLAMALA